MVLLHCMSGDKRFRSCLPAALSCILFLLQSDSLQFQLTTKYDRDASHSNAIYVLSTLLSILTMPLMVGSFELLL